MKNCLVRWCGGTRLGAVSATSLGGRTQTGLPVIGEAWFGIQQDLQNCPAIGARQMCETRTVVLIGQHFPQATVDAVQSRLGQAVESLRVDQVTAGIAKDAPRQIELTQRAAMAVF